MRNIMPQGFEFGDEVAAWENGLSFFLKSNSGIAVRESRLKGKEESQ